VTFTCASDHAFCFAEDIDDMYDSGVNMGTQTMLTG